jgi:hypothetical protein
VTVAVFRDATKQTFDTFCFCLNLVLIYISQYQSVCPPHPVTWKIIMKADKTVYKNSTFQERRFYKLLILLLGARVKSKSVFSSFQECI